MVRFHPRAGSQRCNLQQNKQYRMHTFDQSIDRFQIFEYHSSAYLKNLAIIYSSF